MKKRFGFLIVPALVVMGISPSFANDAPVKSVGKTIQPLNDVPIQMVYENVRIMLSSTMAHVSCRFAFRNEGKPDTVEVGFPRGYEGDLLDFRAGVLGEKGDSPVETMAEKPVYGDNNGEKLPWWKVFKVSFSSPDKPVVVYNHYSTNLIRVGEELLDDLHFTYIMKTGALWKGPIEDAKISVFFNSIPFEQITKISPEGYFREGNRISWNFTNFKPTQDIEVSVMPDRLYLRLEIARELLKREPDSPYAHYLLGTVLYHRNFAEAEKEFQKAISLDPECWDARWFLALISVNKNAVKESLKDSKPLLEAIIVGNPEYRCTDKLYLRDDYFIDDNPKDLLKSLERNGWK